MPHAHLGVLNQRGSVEHFYHFFFSVLVPLFDLASRDALPSRVVIRSCGPMDRHLSIFGEYGLTQIETWDKDTFARECRSDVMGKLDLPTQEFPDHDPVVLTRVRDFCLERFAPVRSDLDVLLIDRGPPDPFYESVVSETPGGGSDRRSIPNMPRIKLRLDGFGRKTHLTRLESMSLLDQMGLFAGARMVVAQHGAALSNLVWSAPGTVVAEVMPTLQKRQRLFVHLARALKLDHVVVPQFSKHSRVKPKHVLRALGEVEAPAEN